MAKKKTTKKAAAKTTPRVRKKRLGAGTGKQHRTPAEKKEVREQFLAGLRDNWGCIADGLRRAGISRDKLKRLRAEDKEFDTEVQDIIEEFTDRLEKEAMKRATIGTEKTVTSMGEVVGTDTVHETGLTMFMLKSKRRDVYGDQVKVTMSPDEFAREVQALVGDEDKSAIKALEGKGE